MAAGLIELTQAHKVSLEPRDEVDVGQLVVLASLTNLQDGVAPFNLDDGVVAKLNCPANSRVKLTERRLGPSHMVYRPRVEDPSPVLLLLVSFTNLSEHSFLLGFEAHRSSYTIVDYFRGLGIRIRDVR